MAMTVGYRNSIATHGAGLITHIGLMNGASELAGGTPAYARKAVTWTAAALGVIRPTANLTFDIPAGATIDSWAGFSAANGGTNYGGLAVAHVEFIPQGTYILLAAGTGITHSDSV